MTADLPASRRPSAPDVLGRIPGRGGHRRASRLDMRLLRLALAPFRPRASGVAHLTDRQLADIGLTRHDLPQRNRGESVDAALALLFGPRR